MVPARLLMFAALSILALPFRAAAAERPNMFDTSIRVPAAVRWPGVMQPGTVVEDVVLNLDWFPTLLAMAGEYSMHHGATTHMRMWRTPKWKLIRDFRDGGRDELYNLQNDPGERKNLIHDQSQEVRRVVEELHAKIVARMRQIRDPALELVKER